MVKYQSKNDNQSGMFMSSMVLDKEHTDYRLFGSLHIDKAIPAENMQVNFLKLGSPHPNLYFM